jgi:hypothetical protein
MKASGAVGVALFGLAMLSVLSGERLATFIELPAGMMLVGTAAALGIMSYGIGDFLHAVWSARVLFARVPHSELSRRDITVLRGAITHLYSGGALTFIVGTILILSHFEQPSGMGMGLAVALLGSLYALILAEVLVRPALRNIDRALVERPAHEMPLLESAEEAWTRVV